MGYEFVFWMIFFDKIIEFYQIVQLGNVGFQGLFDGGNKDFPATVEVDIFSFGMESFQKCNFVNADFGGFFHKEFHSFHAFGRCDGDMDFIRSFFVVFNDFIQINFNGFGVDLRDNSFPHFAFSVGDLNFLSDFSAENFCEMMTFVAVDFGGISFDISNE